MASAHEAGDLIAEQVAAANADGVDTEAPETAPQSSPAEDAGADLILGKFKDQEALVEAYRNLEQANTRTAQEAADLRRQFEEAQQAQQPQQEESWSPFGVVGPMGDELQQYALHDPRGAFEWALQNQNQLGFNPMGTIDQLYGYWASVSPFQASMRLRELQDAWAQEQAPKEDAPDPIASDYFERMASAAYDEAKRTLPEFAAYEPQIKQILSDDPALFEHLTKGNTSAVSLYNAIKAVYGQLSVDAQLRAAQQQQAAPPPAAVQGQTRSTAPAAAGDDGGFSDLILKAARESGMAVNK